MTLVNLCILSDQETGKVLVLDKVHPKWGGISFPGGHICAGESITDSVVREVWEETGLTVHAPKLCGLVRWAPPELKKQKLLFLYRAEVYTGTLRGSDEGEAFWLSREALHSRRLSPNMEVFLKLYEDETLSEAFTAQANDTTEQFLFK